MAAKSEVVDLANQVNTLVAGLLEEWNKRPSEQPPFDSKVWSELATQLQSSTELLTALTTPPASFVRTLQLRHYDLVAYQIALEFDLFTVIPIGQTATLSAIANHSGLDCNRAGRILRLLALHGVFCETEEDTFGHTPRSSIIAQSEAIRSALAIQMCEMYQAASSTADAIQSSVKQNKDISPFAARFGSSIYDYYQQNPEKADRFSLGMKGAMELDKDSLVDLRNSYPWAQFQGGTVVDVGGGTGHVSRFLAKTDKLLFQELPSVSFVVQDILVPPTLENTPNVEFRQHDFFQPQPSTPDAKAFLLRHVLHNYNDTDCIRILSALVPALEAHGESAAPVLLINEGVLPEFGERSARDLHLTIRRGDMCMMVTLSAQERTRKQFQSLLSAADPRLQSRTYAYVC
ncbi:Sterigmatocystin 8-O-methyltransferase [Penicillium rolfsii]|nr:Sterigmatocystin 8-O-methyltransferase [Penicillium rolfsii]